MKGKSNPVFSRRAPGVAAMLFCMAISARAEVFFLNQNGLTAFDGKETRALAAPQNMLAKSAGAPQPLIRLFDWKRTATTNRFLVSKQRDNKYVAGTDVPSGYDFWLRNESGAERLVHPSVYRAKFSPDGAGLAYTTTDCELKVEDLNGRKLAGVERAYNPSWRRDGRSIVFEKIPEGHNAHLPETLHLAKMDVATGQVELLTDGSFDDVRPEFHPSGRWILFVSGGRTGLASFWKMDASGGQPAQITNLGSRRVDEKFVPTPYQTTTWSADGQWFLYDFKSGDTQQIWGLQFDEQGRLRRALKLANGLTPQWLEDGRTFAFLKPESDGGEPAVQTLP